MKNVWKGLVIGACTGAGVGLVMDAIYGSGRAGLDLAEHGRDKLKDAHLGARAHDVATEIAGSVRADLAPAARDALATAAQTVKEEVGPKVKAAGGTVNDMVAG